MTPAQAALWEHTAAGRRAASAHLKRLVALMADIRRREIDDETEARWPGWDDVSAWNTAAGLERARTAALWRRSQLEKDTTP